MRGEKETCTEAGDLEEFTGDVPAGDRKTEGAMAVVEQALYGGGLKTGPGRGWGWGWVESLSQFGNS